MMDLPTDQNSASESEKDAAGRSSFLCLPAEIRNKIYRYSLVEDPCADRIHGLAQPALVRTNRQIRSEALPIYYGENRFHLTIPSPSSNSDPEDWADFIRMFRVFKAGRSGGRGTGSLRFLQDMVCRMNAPHPRLQHWKTEVSFVAISRRRGSGDGGGPEPGGVPLVPSNGQLQAWQNRDCVYTSVRRFLAERSLPPSIMRDSCIHRLISTIVMVASECTDVTEYVGFHSMLGRPWFEDDSDEDYDISSENSDHSPGNSQDSSDDSE